MPSRSSDHARTRRPRGSLGRDVILDAAERVGCGGFHLLTMRAVAGELQAVPMALYTHFATKDELVDALLDRVLMRFEPEPATDDWLEDLRRFARAHRRLLVEHPWAVAPLFARPNPGLGAVRVGEVALGILHRGGFSQEQAVAVFSGIVALNYGWSSFTGARDDGAGLEAVLAALPRDEYPRTVEVAGHMAAYGSDAHYELVLDLVLAGVAAPGVTRPPS